MFARWHSFFLFGTKEFHRCIRCAETGVMRKRELLSWKKGSRIVARFDTHTLSALYCSPPYSVRCTRRVLPKVRSHWELCKRFICMGFGEFFGKRKISLLSNCLGSLTSSATPVESIGRFLCIGSACFCRLKNAQRVSAWCSLPDCVYRVYNTACAAKTNAEPTLATRPLRILEI